MAADRCAGYVCHDIDPAEFLVQPAKHVPYLGFIGDIARHGDRAPAHAPDFLRGPLDRRAVDVRDQQVGAGTRRGRAAGCAPGSGRAPDTRATPAGHVEDGRRVKTLEFLLYVLWD